MWSLICCISNLKICIKEIIYCVEEFYELNFTEVDVTSGGSEGTTKDQHSTRTNISLISLGFLENPKNIWLMPLKGSAPSLKEIRDPALVTFCVLVPSQ